MNLKKISDRLQNPISEEDRINALADLKILLRDAHNLLDKYRTLATDWTKEIKSKLS